MAIKTMTIIYLVYLNQKPCLISFKNLIIQIVTVYAHLNALRKHAYSNILRIPKKENFQIRNSDIFHMSAQNIDCWYSLEPPCRGGSNEYHNLCVRAEIRKNVYPCKPRFFLYESGL